MSRSYNPVQSRWVTCREAKEPIEIEVERGFHMGSEVTFVSKCPNRILKDHERYCQSLNASCPYGLDSDKVKKDFFQV